MFTIINDSNNYNNSYVVHFLLFLINAYSNFRLKINIIREINIFHITSSDIKICDERNNILSANIYISYDICNIYTNVRYISINIYRNICLIRLIEIFYICCFMPILISLNCMNITSCNM